MQHAEPAQHQVQAPLNRPLLSRLGQAGLTLLENDAADQNLGLIVCLMQRQMAGAPAAMVTREARRVRDELVQHSDAWRTRLQRGSGLHADRPFFSALADRVFGPGNVPQILVMTEGGRSCPVLFDPMSEPLSPAVNPAAVAHDATVLLIRRSRLSLVANTSGRPWCMVLAQWRADLQVHAAGITPARALGVRSMAADTPLQHRPWLLGRQTCAAPQDLDEDAPPMVRARAMAQAQEVADDVLAALGQWVAYDLGRTVAADGSEVHRLGMSPRTYYKSMEKYRLEDGRRAPAMPALDEGETGFQYVVELHGRLGHLSSMKVDSSGDGCVDVRFDIPRPADLRTVLPERPLQAPFELRMDNGVLFVQHTLDHAHGALQHLAIYTPDEAAGRTVPLRDFQPSQPAIIRGELQRYLELFEVAGDAMGMPALDAALTPEGNLVLMDGHHRCLAAVTAGVSIPVLIRAVPEPGLAIAPDWSAVSLRDTPDPETP